MRREEVLDFRVGLLVLAAFAVGCAPGIEGPLQCAPPDIIGEIIALFSGEDARLLSDFLKELDSPQIPSETSGGAARWLEVFRVRVPVDIFGRSLAYGSSGFSSGRRMFG